MGFFCLMVVFVLARRPEIPRSRFARRALRQWNDVEGGGWALARVETRPTGWNPAICG